ncbi:NAD dependent epimerase/dehydratase [Exidia glandulosa HHB12029]|uniref:NAD dependent epimerase/dehydratase n=1 Tax=Exidia glandulosa HHB12029 TaxID=1314781 RepID=A0A165LQ77_EXIGL|nr:NAD dependent epimerase/dehydratase [Exidia glandulosa HHB12029]
MSSSPTYLVSGATGEQGGSVARELLKAGYRVHALVRDASKAQAKELESLGAVLFVGDFNSVEVINKATVGVKGVFINPYPDFTNPEGEAQTAQRFVDAARAAGTVEHLVISTSLHTGEHEKYLAIDPNYPLKPYYQSKAAAEAVVRNSGVKYWTVLRPPWLYQNYTFPSSTLHFPQLHTDRIFSSCLDPVTPFVHFHGADVGYWVHAAFENPAKFAGKEIKLGTEALNLEQIVRGLEKAAGVEIPTKWLDPLEVAKDTSDPVAPMRAAVAIWQNISPFHLTLEEFETVKSYGIPLTTFEQWLEKDKASILKTLKVSA